MTRELLRRVTQSGTILIGPGEIHDKFIIRFVVSSQFTTADDILQAWNIISKAATALLAETWALNNADQSHLQKD